jgi:hypothetical protein
MYDEFGLGSASPRFITKPPGYFWEHNPCIYIGGVLFYRTDPADNVVKLFYNPGRGSFQADVLCPDPDWPQGDWGSNRDCWVGSARRTQ